MSPAATKIRIATRESRLALAQTNLVADALRAHDPTLQIEILGMTTRGDRVLDRPLSQVGGKGLFIKELEVALEEDRADIAVHSLKDVPMEIPAHFTLTTFGEREVALDAFVSNRYAALEAMPAQSLLGTSSLRRECQLRHAYPHLRFAPLRGNVNTRLAKLDAGEYDAIILAAAGLRRLGLAERIRATLAQTLAVPAIGQGILAIEHLAARSEVGARLAHFQVASVAAAARAERALGLVVEGSCEVPVAAHAQVRGEEIEMEAFLGLPDGSRVMRDRHQGRVEDAAGLGRALGERLLAAGGTEILRELALHKPQ